MTDYINIMLGNLTRLEADLSEDPVKPKKVSMFSRKHGDNVYFYKSSIVHKQRKQIYLGNADSDKLRTLARSAYKRELVNIVRQNIKVLKNASNKFQPIDRAEIISRLSPCLRSVLFDTSFDTVMKKLREWAAADYERNPKAFPDKVIRAKDGTRVRSRAECIIYNLFLEAGIPFHYDPVMHFKMKNHYDEVEDVLECPDFQIKCPDGNFILLEHAGMLSSPQYANDLVRKVQLYQLNGYMIGYSLFVTSDNYDGGIDSSEIDKIVQLIKARFIYL